MPEAAPRACSPLRSLRLHRPASARIIPPDSSFLDIIEALLHSPKHRSLYAVDNHGRLLGLVELPAAQAEINARHGNRGYALLGILRREPRLKRETATRLLRPTPAVHEHTSIRVAPWLAQDFGIDSNPVTDRSGRLVIESTAAEYLEFALVLALASRPSS